MMDYITFCDHVRADLLGRKGKSAWDKGVTVYAIELIDNLEDYLTYNPCDLHTLKKDKVLKPILLAGARDWYQYSWGGCALVYDGDICKRLCSPSAIRKTQGGLKRIKQNVDWLDLQAEALNSAAFMAGQAIRRKLKDIEAENINSSGRV